MTSEWWQFWGAVVGVLIAGLRYSYQMDKVIAKMDGLGQSLDRIERDFSAIVGRVVALEEAWSRAFPREDR